jgi:hypothetical protein
MSVASGRISFQRNLLLTRLTGFDRLTANVSLEIFVSSIACGFARLALLCVQQHDALEYLSIGTTVIGDIDIGVSSGDLDGFRFHARIRADSRGLVWPQTCPELTTFAAPNLVRVAQGLQLNSNAALATLLWPRLRSVRFLSLSNVGLRELRLPDPFSVEGASFLVRGLLAFSHALCCRASHCRPPTLAAAAGNACSGVRFRRLRRQERGPAVDLRVPRAAQFHRVP